MKTIISALALIIAAPAAAQTAAPAPESGHQHHKGMDHSQHKGMDHSKHQMDCCKDGKHKECCEQAMKDGKKMPCCDQVEAKTAAPEADAGHSGHDH